MKLPWGKTAVVDRTTLEVIAATRSITRRDTGEGYQEDLRWLVAEQGAGSPTYAEVRRFDRQRKKKGSNAE